MTTLNDFLGDLRHDLAPTKNRWQPHWTWNGSYNNPPFAADDKAVTIPAYDSEWIWGEQRDGLIQVDVNAAWVSTIGQAELPMYRVEARKDLDFDPEMAGYWQVEVPEWEHDDLFLAPWGQRSKPGTMRWMTTPTVKLMHECYAEGLLRDKPNLGPISHVHWDTIQLTAWYRHLREERMRIRQDTTMSTAEREEYKRLYAQAINVIGSGRNKPGNVRGSAIYRPEWKHTLLCHHAAMMWRRAWTCITHGIPVEATGRQDALYFTPDAFMDLYERLLTGKVSWTSQYATTKAGTPRVLGSIRFDDSGDAVGAFKLKGI